MRRLDVTDPKSVQRCVSGLIGEFGGIDLLINNAGTTHIGLAESTSEAEAQRVFETNFFGAVRMTAALLPGMRQRRRGRIITISSLAGLVPAPGQAVYAASKHAIEGYFESLSHELHGTGVEIALVEPGFFKTSLHEAATGGAATEDEGGATAGVESGYGETPEKLRAAVEKGFKGGGDPRRVAKVVVQIADAPKVRLRYRIGADAVWVPRIRRWLPPGVFDRGVRQRFGLG
jgi:NAD(P)-dependent dehydrogenase (short-subunit alcohol dehydrogenase family)